MDSPKPAAAVRLKIDQRWLGENREGRERELHSNAGQQGFWWWQSGSSQQRDHIRENEKKSLIVLCCE